MNRLSLLAFAGALVIGSFTAAEAYCPPHPVVFNGTRTSQYGVNFYHSGYPGIRIPQMTFDTATPRIDCSFVGEYMMSGGLDIGIQADSVYFAHPWTDVAAPELWIVSIKNFQVSGMARGEHVSNAAWQEDATAALRSNVPLGALNTMRALARMHFDRAAFDLVFVHSERATKPTAIFLPKDTRVFVSRDRPVLRVTANFEQFTPADAMKRAEVIMRLAREHTT